jgi:hypothetical protein
VNPNVLLAYLICVAVTLVLALLCDLFYKDPDHEVLMYVSITGLPGVILGVPMLARAVGRRTWICVLWIRRKLFH